MKNSSVLLIFIDGLGIGERAESNPLARIKNIEPLSNFQNESSQIIFNGVLTSTDARLGIEGRPQSASGQTTILTGINAPQLLGFHKQGFPNQILRDAIEEHSIFLQLKRKEIEPNVFANAYTPQFFQEIPRWKSATTCAVEAADLSFRRLPDLLGHKAIFHDFTNKLLQERGFDIPLFTPAEAAAILAGLAEEHCFTLYEHFITDKIGHAQDYEKAEEHLPLLAEFIREILQKVDRENTTVILTSDHGNIEDLSVRTHTLNDVPTIIWGRKRKEISKRIRDLSDISPAILSLLS
ncbi:MAG: alkaline phosphatase family protein [Acidobacteria bacterium]|nr:alkaline phosphatase family protein [Acidobacteriota bacterium]MCA1636941.1 alkaline phosphatase family protein [Acidobacteriota bacterium]